MSIVRCGDLARRSLAALSLWLTAGCASLEGDGMPRGPTLASGGYSVAGPLIAKPFVFSGRTVLEFSASPGHIEVTDASGVAVPVERAGRFVKLPRVLNDFTVWVNGKQMTVMSVALPVGRSGASVDHDHASALPDPEATALVPVGATAGNASGPGEPSRVEKPPKGVSTGAIADVGAAGEVVRSSDAFASMRALVAVELNAIKSRNGHAPGSHAASSTKRQRLEDVEQRLQARAIKVDVKFAFARVDFKPDRSVAHSLIHAASAAGRIEVRGYTSSAMASHGSTRVALQRALGARSYLIDHGVDPSKIDVRYWSAGAFIETNQTAVGRARNQRVEIELQFPLGLADEVRRHCHGSMLDPGHLVKAKPSRSNIAASRHGFELGRDVVLSLHRDRSSLPSMRSFYV